MFSAYDSLYSKIATLGGAIVFREALEGVVNMGKLGGQVKNVTDAFSRLEGSTALLNKLKEATKGGVTDLELMRNALIGIDLGATNEQMETFARFARFESVRKGRDELEMLQNIMSGVLRGSTELLDNFGISLTDLNSRIAQMATESGKSATKLSDVERRQLAVAAATKIMKERLDSLGDSSVTDAEKINQAAVAWENLKNKLSTIASPGVSTGMGEIAKGLDLVVKSLEAYQKQGFGAISSTYLAFLNQINPAAAAAAKYAMTTFDGKPASMFAANTPKPGEQSFMGPAQGLTPANNRNSKVENPYLLTNSLPPPPPAPPPPGGSKTPALKWYKSDLARAPKELEFGLGEFYQSPVPRKGAPKLNETPILPGVEVLDNKFDVVFSDAEQLALKTTGAIGDAFLSLGSQIGSEFNNLWVDMFGQGKTVFDRLAISLLSSFTSSIAQIVGQFAAASIMNAFLPGSGALIGGLFGRAGGGPVTAGQPYMVGERGPEIFIPQQSGRIAPSLNFNDTINVEGFLPDEIMQAITKRRNLQRDELIKMLRDIKAVNRMPS